MSLPDTLVLPFDDDAIAQAAALIVDGRPVAVPTETVYGLAADATNGEAVARIYEAKGRPSFNPLIVHVRDTAAARAYAHFDEAAERLAASFWPGPLTIVLPLRDDAGIAPLATAGLATVALRVPAGRAMQYLLEAGSKPLAAPSANASGSISPTRAGHVLASLGGRIPLIIDDGATRHGLESTIVAVGADQLRLLRPGPIDADALQRVAGLPLATVRADRIEAPGQMASHYAPSKPLRLDVAEVRAGEWLIGFGEVRGDDSVSATGDLVEAAARLFQALHDADAAPSDAIAVAPIPETGLGIAINDRLRRAAAPR